MTRRLLLTLTFAALAALAHADSPAPVPAHVYVARFQKDLVLVEALVESGVRLANDEDPLARAESSTEVARRFAAEVQIAAEERDAARAAELGSHLHNLLERSVAPNLTHARKLIPLGSTEERKLREINKQVETLLQPLRSSLRSAADGEAQGEVRSLLEELFRRQAELEKSLRGPAAQQLD